MSDIRTEYGITGSVKLGDFYAGGPKGVLSAGAPNVPSTRSGVRMSHFYGAFKVLTPAFNAANAVSGNSSSSAVTFDPKTYQTTDTRYIGTLQWSIVGTAPSGVTIDTNTGVVTVSQGTNVSATTLQIRATGPAGSATLSVPITIEAYSAPSVGAILKYIPQGGNGLFTDLWTTNNYPGFSILSNGGANGQINYVSLQDNRTQVNPNVHYFNANNSGYCIVVYLKILPNNINVNLQPVNGGNRVNTFAFRSAFQKPGTTNPYQTYSIGFELATNISGQTIFATNHSLWTTYSANAPMIHNSSNKTPSDWMVVVWNMTYINNVQTDYLYINNVLYSQQSSSATNYSNSGMPGSGWMSSASPTWEQSYGPRCYIGGANCGNDVYWLGGFAAYDQPLSTSDVSKITNYFLNLTPSTPTYSII